MKPFGTEETGLPSIMSTYLRDTTLARVQSRRGPPGPPNSVKFFAALEVLELAKDRA